MIVSTPTSDAYQAVLVVSFGGPEGRDEVLPFLENVLRGRNVPRERLMAVAEHYFHFGGVSPINAQNRALIAALQTDKSELEMRLSDSEKQRMALQGVLDQPERLKIIQAGNCSIERTIWVCLSVAALAMSGMFASQYFRLRAKRREDIVRLIAQNS